MSVRPSSGLAPKLALLAGTTLVCGGLAYLGYEAWRKRSAGPTVEVVDNTAQLIDALTGRSRTDVAPPIDPGDGRFPPPLIREPLDAKTAKVFFSFVGRGKFDPYLYYTHEISLDTMFDFAEHPAGKFRIQTNSLGMREANEVRNDVPGLRILVTGDSHTDGVCGNDESFSSLLEIDLTRAGKDVEVLNCATFGYSFYQYLATLEHYLYLKPNVFVVAVYGGNDFYGMLSLQRYFHRRAAPKIANPQVYDQIKAIDPKRASGIAAQELTQVRYFKDNPEDVDVSVATAASIADEIARLGKEHAIEVIFVYLPPAYRAQPDFTKDDLARFLAPCGFVAEDLAVSDRIANRFIAFLEERGTKIVDMRPRMRESKERLYWVEDQHLNLAGHRLVADELKKRL